jgi:putative transposase
VNGLGPSTTAKLTPASSPPLLPGVELSPEEMFNRGLQISGTMKLPSSEDLRFEFLEVVWRQIHHYGVDINGRRYDGEALNVYRGTRSEYGGTHPGKWPFHVDVDDVRTVYFRDPVTHEWHELKWRSAELIVAPFSQDAADYTRRIAQVENRHVDPHQAVNDLLQRWAREEVESRRSRVVAQRLATQATTQSLDSDDPTDATSLPGVLDFIKDRPTKPKTSTDADELDVFERYFLDHPDDSAEVFDE